MGRIGPAPEEKTDAPEEDHEPHSKEMVRFYEGILSSDWNRVRLFLGMIFVQVFLIICMAANMGDSLYRRRKAEEGADDGADDGDDDPCAR